MRRWECIFLFLATLLLPINAFSQDCGGVPDQGCCQENDVKFCESGFVFTEDCLTTCGWNPLSQYYECGFEGASPSADLPLACPCIPNCDGKDCGDNGCGGSCGTCNPTQVCAANNTCVPKTGNPSSCANACNAASPNGSCYCVPQCLDSGNCCADACLLCGICEPCTPTCGGKECGDDGCGGQCGACQTGEYCENGNCNPIEVPSATCKNACGEASSDGSCYCDMSCLQYNDCCIDACEECDVCGECTPNCTGKECGNDGCGGACGNCPVNTECKSGICEEKDDNCEPDCVLKSCGDDGCGGTCGACPQGEICDTETNSWTCAPNPDEEECLPDCVAKTCGDDGCGGSCGDCSAGLVCAGSLCEPVTQSESETNIGNDLNSIGTDDSPGGSNIVVSSSSVPASDGGCSTGNRIPWGPLTLALLFLVNPWVRRPRQHQ